jgi:hypothetical protein
MSVRKRATIMSLLAPMWLAWCALGSSAETPLTLDELLKEYKKHELPLPPKDAMLVRYESFDSGIAIINDKLQPRMIDYSLAFVMEPGSKKEQRRLLTGTRWCRPDEAPNKREVVPPPDAARGIDLKGEDGLVLAIQCHARGWGTLARYALEQSQIDAKTSPRNQLLKVAWWYWRGRLTNPKLDRVPAAKHLNELIGQNKEWDTGENRALLKSLDLALTPRKSKPGSIEALIDDLVDYNADAGTLGLFEPEQRYWTIANLGFDSVPALIEHLNDDRLTRATMQRFNNFPDWNLRVGDVAGDLLEGLAGEETGRNWLDRQNGYRVNKAKAKVWWDKARKVGEETYLMKHVFVETTDRRKAHVSEHLLHVILAKYPKRVPPLYRIVLDKRPELDSGILVEAFVRCKLPVKEKMDLLVYAAKHKENEHRLPALHAIKKLDQKQFNVLLLATIASFPKDVSGSYWSCPEAYLAALATECDDPRIWPMLEKVAKRSAVGLRMEMLNRLNNPQDNRHRTERFHLVGSFLNDDASRIGYWFATSSEVEGLIVEVRFVLEALTKWRASRVSGGRM